MESILLFYCYIANSHKFRNVMAYHVSASRSTDLKSGNGMAGLLLRSPKANIRVSLLSLPCSCGCGRVCFTVVVGMGVSQETPPGECPDS